MTYESKIAKRRTETNKSETTLIKITITIAVSVLFTVFSVCFNYLGFFMQQAAVLTNSTMPQILKNSVSNFAGMARYVLTFLEYFSSMPVVAGDTFIPVPTSDNAESLFSPEAVVENLPLTLILMLIVTLIAVYSSLSIVFSVCRRNRQSFYATLMASGASDKFIRKCVFNEIFYYCNSSVSLGLLLGGAEIYLIRFVSEKIFTQLSESYGNLVFPVRIQPSGEMAFFVVYPLIYLMVGVFSKRICKKLSVKTITSNAKKSSVPNIGIRAMTAEPKTYKRFGIEGFVAFRNFQSNLGKYFRITGMTMLYVILIGASFIIFSTMRSFNGQEIMSNKEILSLSFATEFLICAVTLAVAAVTLVGTFCAVSANVNSNIGEYALMKSSGSSLKSILKAVRLEGGFCISFGVISCISGSVFFASLINQIYREDSRVAVNDIGPMAVAVSVALALFVLVVAFTIASTNKKMKRINMVETLKDLFY